jgi:uncharacterized repeat protein (TIGR03803 family)
MMNSTKLLRHSLFTVGLITLGLSTSTSIGQQAGFSVLHGFTGQPDGAQPTTALVSSGNTFYGTTPSGGSSFNQGTLFSLKADGSGYTVLDTFTNNPDGTSPRGTLVIAGDTLYGTTYSGGTNGGGTVFSIKTNGANYTILHNFDYTSGGNPVCSLTLLNGVLYGSTEGGGMSSPIRRDFSDSSSSSKRGAVIVVLTARRVPRARAVAPTLGPSNAL